MVGSSVKTKGRSEIKNDSQNPPGLSQPIGYLNPNAQ